METNPREDIETRREWGFAMMRSARVVGQFIFYVSVIVICAGVIMSLLNLPTVLCTVFTLGKYAGPPTEGNLFGLTPIAYTLGGFVILALGFAGAAIGGAIIKPYQFTTEMPSTYVRVCRYCGEPLPKEWVIHSCPKCSRFLPLGFSAYVARLVSKSVTYLNWVIAILAFIFIVR